MEGLPPRRSGAIRGDDARYPRVHPPLPDARVAARLPSHPLLRPADQPNPRQEYCTHPWAARSSTHPDRGHQGRQHKGFDKRSVRRAESARASLPLLRRPHAHHRDLLARATAEAPPDPASAEDQDRHLMTTSEPPPRKAVRPSTRSSAGYSGARSNDIHHATATPMFRHTPARSSEKCVASELQRHRHPRLPAPPTSDVARPRPKS